MGKQPFLPCHITEECRQRLISFLIIQLMLGLICGTALIGVGLYIRSHIRDKVNLIEGYDFDQLPITLMVVGGATILLNLVSAKIGHEASFAWKRKKLRKSHVLLTLMIILIIVASGLLIGGSMTFYHRRSLRKSFHNGLSSAMDRYKDDILIKAEIDLLQLEFGCCGNQDFEDWFTIQWINDEYINQPNRPARDATDQEQSEGEASNAYLTDDLPFSCCHLRSMRPCIHHKVLDNGAHFRYDSKLSFTYYKTGCKHRLMEYFNKRLNIIGSCVMGLMGLQLTALTTAQYLFTSICNALDKGGSPKRTAKGWMFEEFPLVTFLKWLVDTLRSMVV